ncbi:XisI protein [Geminocystis sp. CENA526]|uniref:XisI protein n=1 Tax=Geminocystis sp. CENA526 TaxID=1355871 RepID=UPI003D6E168C
MDKLTQYQDIIVKVLNPYLNIQYANINIKNYPAYDHEHQQYLIISQGWQDNKHFHSCLIHLEIIKGKIWIQCDNTEDGIANELVSAGISSKDIILGFHEPSIRKYTGFAVA